MSAATELATATVPLPGWAPLGIPVRRGRLTLGRAARELVITAGRTDVAVLAGSGTACWLGPPTMPPPALGQLAYRATSTVDARGRLVLDRRARAWLGVADSAAFPAVLIPAPSGGLFLVPVEDFDRRWQEVRADERLAG